MPRLPYAASGLDRGGSRRGDERWISGLLAGQATVIIPMWRDNCLIDGGGQVRWCAPDAADLLAACGQPAFLGVRAEGAVFAADLSELDEPAALSVAGATATADMRALFASLTGPDAAALAYARGLLRWHREQRFCGACGGATQAAHGGHQRSCEGCGRLLFPRIEPAVIALVTAPPEPGREDRCLLARHRGAKPGAFATLAGFVEIGESLEDAVRREVTEETGVRVGEVSYQGSQPWPFPSGIMAGFRAGADRDDRRGQRGAGRSALVHPRPGTRRERRPAARLDRALPDRRLAQRIAGKPAPADPGRGRAPGDPCDTRAGPRPQR